MLKKYFSTKNSLYEKNKIFNISKNLARYKFENNFVEQFK